MIVSRPSFKAFNNLQTKQINFRVQLVNSFFLLLFTILLCDDSQKKEGQQIEVLYLDNLKDRLKNNNNLV